MGNLHSAHEIRELFDKLDIDKSGSLGLREIITSGLPELADTSLLCLFRFDANLEGSINYHDFVNLIKHLKRLEKEKVLKSKRGGIGYNLRRLLHKKEQKRPTKCWKALDFRKAEEIKSKLTRNSQTPQIVGKEKEKEGYDSDESSDYYSYESSDNENEIDEEEEREGRLFLNKSLREGGKEKFMTWLFKLADSKKVERVSLEELGLFLKLIARDHINTSSLTYNDHEIDDNTPEYISKSIMDEFDVGKTGYLRREEFMVLAELIADYYDELVSNSQERYIKDFRLKWKLGEGASGVVMLAIKESPNISSHSSASLLPNNSSSSSLNEQRKSSLHALNNSNNNHNNNNNNNNNNHHNNHHNNHNGNHSRSNSGSNLLEEDSFYQLNGINNHNRYAIKIIQKNSINDFSLIDKEIQAMLMIRHPNVVELYEVLEDAENVYFVMELCGGGSIADYIAVKPFSEDLSRTYFKQLLLAVHHCHEVGIVHRDLKLENLLLDNEGVLHVSDFGQSGIFQAGWDLFSTATGCILHICPEQIKGETYSGEKSDTWAIGVALYRMLFAIPPFFATNPQDMIDNIVNAKFEFPKNIKVSQEVKDLICKFLKPDPNERIDLAEALTHPWLHVEKTYNPSLLRHYISKKCNNTIEELWNNLKTLVKKFEIVPVQVNDISESPNQYIHKLKCHYPHKDLKFSIHLKKSDKVASDDDSDSSFSSLDEGKSAKDTKERYYLEFSLWDGESFVFRKLSEKIIRRFERSLTPKYGSEKRKNKRHRKH